MIKNKPLGEMKMMTLRRRGRGDAMNPFKRNKDEGFNGENAFANFFENELMMLNSHRVEALRKKRVTVTQEPNDK